MSESASLDTLTVAHDALARSEGEEGGLRCCCCAHRCLLSADARGVCLLRFNRDGRLRVPFGYVSGLACDPIEKKPFYHFHPGVTALSYGMLGCNLHCWFCQNWYTSQTLRDAHASTSGLTRCTPAELVQAAEANDAPVIASTYNEPIITSEWSHAVFSLAKVRGLSTCYVTNGHGTTELWDYLAPCLDAANVDLKCFTSEGYRRLGGRLEAVRESIATLERLGVWVEVTTLVVPGFNDDPAELRAAAEFLVSISPDIPWHLSAFHPDYRCRDVGPTPLSLLMDTADTGRSAGLRYVYIGNVASRDGGTTFCPACGEAVVKRSGFRVQALALRDGCCSACGAPIAGHWG